MVFPFILFNAVLKRNLLKLALAKRTENQRKIALKTLFLVAETYSSAILKYVQLLNSILKLGKKHKRKVYIYYILFAMPIL